MPATNQKNADLVMLVLGSLKEPQKISKENGNCTSKMRFFLKAYDLLTKHNGLNQNEKRWLQKCPD